MLKKEAQQRTFSELMELFVLPEVTRRKEAGRLPEKFRLNAAQILFYSDGRKPAVRLNEETKIIATVKFKNIVNKQKGEAVFWNEIDNVENLRLIDEEDKEYAHVSMLRLKGHWNIAFDFRYNKGAAREHFKVAKEFYKAAKNAHKNRWLAPFVDNLFSCIELLAKSELLLLSEVKKKTTHVAIQMKYNRFVNCGNEKSDFKAALNKLSAIRHSARYLSSSFSLLDSEGGEYLNTAKEMLDYLEARLSN
jgi:uncharacterized protein (UPF0332 family)